jgi:hypothetical protein
MCPQQDLLSRHDETLADMMMVSGSRASMEGETPEKNRLRRTETGSDA